MHKHIGAGDHRLQQGQIGGLAQVNVVLSIFFAGVSGSSTADAASQSKIFIEAQRKEGYDDSFSVAITAVSAVLAACAPDAAG